MSLIVAMCRRAAEELVVQAEDWVVAKGYETSTYERNPLRENCLRKLPNANRIPTQASRPSAYLSMDFNNTTSLLGLLEDGYCTLTKCVPSTAFERRSIVIVTTYANSIYCLALLHHLG